VSPRAAGRTSTTRAAGAPDRLIADRPARHFDIELSEAALAGGGRIAGRVHRHGVWRPGRMTVEVRCRELWRERVCGPRGVPSWDATWLWRHAAALDVDPDATWAPFDVRIPAHLPPAIEARTIAWRYEVLVRRRRRGFAESAVTTPLLHEEFAPGWMWP
jgi:hypothetical protein